MDGLRMFLPKLQPREFELTRKWCFLYTFVSLSTTNIRRFQDIAQDTRLPNNCFFGIVIFQQYHRVLNAYTTKLWLAWILILKNAFTQKQYIMSTKLSLVWNGSMMNYRWFRWSSFLRNSLLITSASTSSINYKARCTFKSCTLDIG